MLRVPLSFGRAHGDFRLTESGVVATKGVAGYIWRSAASKVAMRSGRHFARFTVVEGESLFFGVVRPGWDVEGGAQAFHEDGHCFFDTAHDGKRYSGNFDWQGKQTARGQGDRIGMLIDLDQGSMPVWKNDAKLGVMQAAGLRGPLAAGRSRWSGRAAAHALSRR